MDGMRIVMRSRPRSSPTLSALRERILQKRYRAFKYESRGLSRQSRELFEAAAENLERLPPYLPAAKRRKKPRAAAHQVATKRSKVDRPKAPHAPIWLGARESGQYR